MAHLPYLKRGLLRSLLARQKGKQLLVDVMLSARRNFNLVCARVSTGELPGAPSCAPGYAHSALSQRIYDAAFARGSAIPARY